MSEGIDYYKSLFEDVKHIFEDIREDFLFELEAIEKSVNNLLLPQPALVKVV